MIRTAVLFFSFLVSVQAGCDNSCSGHGVCECGFCECYDNWGMGLSHDSGDCSDRICPFELAWVDSPDKLGQHHKYAECAGRGICDRTSGECECFDGYEGKGCQRTTCPNDCSGHGICSYIQDMGYGSTTFDMPHNEFDSIDIATFNYYAWDAQKTRGCVCDPEYADVDCSKRLCPYGNDMQDRRLDQTTHVKYQKQRVQFSAASLAAAAGGSFSLIFTSKLNETFTTIPIVADFGTMGAKWESSRAIADSANYDANLKSFASKVQSALMNLPNKVIDDVVVEIIRYKDDTAVMKPDPLTNAAYSGDGELFCGGELDAAEVFECLDIEIQFTGENVRGPQNLLAVQASLCGDGCYPKTDGLILQQGYKNNVVQDPLSAADYNSFECGRRGKCDYDTGICECFAGFTGQSCSQCTSLI